VDVAARRGVSHLVAGDAIRPVELERWEADHRVQLGAGDALLLRTGWATRRATLGSYPGRKPRPGLHASTLPWLHERRIALVVADAAHDAVPSGYTRVPMPIHTIGIAAMGLCLVDNADLDGLAEAMAARGRWTCALVVAPLRLVGASGSPVTPLAML
jgi:kynurenine formamidase